MKGKSHLTNLIALYNDKTSFEMTVEAVYPDFTMTFSAVYYSIITDKPMKYRPAKRTVRCAELLSSKDSDQWHKIHLETILP